GQARPIALVLLLERSALGIRTVAEDHREAAFLRRPEDVRTKDHAVIHPDRNVPIDLHAVANFGLAFRHGAFLCALWVQQSKAIAAQEQGLPARGSPPFFGAFSFRDICAQAVLASGVSLP